MSLIDALTSYYSMEEQTGATRIDSVNGYNLTDHGGIVKVQGKQGLAGKFGGSQYGSHPTQIDFQISTVQDGFSVAFWLYPTDFSNTIPVMSKTKVGTYLTFNEWEIDQDTSGHIIWSVYSSAGTANMVTSSSVLTLSTWNFVVVTYRRSDGFMTSRTNCDAPANTTLSPNTPYHPGSDFNIGAGDAGTVHHFYIGSIDQIGVWQRLLQEAEIDTLCASSFFLQAATYQSRSWSFTG